VPLTSVTLDDDVLGSISLASTTLAPGASTTGQATHTVTQDDVDAGSIVNVATVTGTAPDQSTVSDEDSETVNPPRDPSIAVDKESDYTTLNVGDTITYDYTVTNDGNVTLTNVTLDDDVLGSISLASTTLAPGASSTGQATHTVTQDDVDAGSIVNVATVTGTAPDQSTVTDDDTETVNIDRNPSIDLDKESDYTTLNVGDTITYDYTVTNDGNVTLTNVTLDDDVLGAISLGSTTLAPGASTTGQAKHTVTQDDVDAGSIVNVATVTGTAPDQSTVTDEDSETVNPPQDPSIDIDKEADYTTLDVGDTITYDYTVTNDGNVTLTNVTLDDDVLGAISLGSTTLAPGASTTGQATHTVTQDDVDAGSIVNVATATGTAPDQSTVQDQDDVTVNIGQNPSIDVDKESDYTTLNVGDTITYDYTVTNDGTVTLTNVTLDDDVLGSISLGSTTLAPGASTTGQATHTVTQDDIDTGSIVNVAAATGTAPDQSTVTDEDSETVNVDRNPSIDVDKIASYTTLNVGDTITYDYTVTNDGNVTLTNVTLDDDVLGSISLGSTTLAPGASTTGQAAHTVTQDDVDAGSIVNVATARGTAPDQSTVTDEDSERVDPPQDPSIDLDKESDYTTLNVGDTITYDYTVTNDGNVTLTNVTLDDDVLGSISLGSTTLAPGASTTGQATHIVTQDDVDAGSIVNVATVTGTTPDQSTVTDDDTETVNIPRLPSIDVDKVASYTTLNVGDTITYDYTVTNDGNVTLTNVTLDDDVLGSISLGSTTLAPGASTTGQATHTVTQDDVDAGSIVNVATATGTASDQSTVQDQDDVTVNIGQNPSIDVDKVADYTTLNVGDTITYDYTVTNDGTVTLTNVTLDDDVLGSISLGSTTLAPGASTTGQATHTVTQDDVDAGSIVNIATATGTAPDQSTVTDDDTETVSIPRLPSIDVDKVASYTTLNVGDTITYDYTVTNDGNVTLTNVTLDDDVLGSISLGSTTLAPGASTTGQATHTVTQDDVDAGSIVNVATVTGTAPDQSTVTDQDTARVSPPQSPALSIDKTGDAGPVAVGDTVAYTITVTNTGNVTLHTVVVSDPLLGISQNLGTLAPLASQVVNGTYGPVTAGDQPGPIVNTATADSDETGPVSDDHSVPILTPNPSLTIVKDGPGEAVVGDTIDYEITVTNTGGEVLHNVVITDPMLGLSQNIGTLGIGASVTLTATYGPVLDSDLPGPIVNTATADSDETDPVSDDHLVHLDTPPLIDLSLSIDVDNPTPDVGSDVVFTITLANADGYATATGVEVKDLLPTGYTYVDSDPEIGTFNEITSTWSVGVVPPGVSVTLEITATVEPTGDYDNEAEVSKADQQDVDSTPGNASTSSEDDDDAVPVAPGDPIEGFGGSLECFQRVIINEVAWAGTAADPMHEWVELRNLGNEPVDLTGWTLQWRRKSSVQLVDEDWHIVPLSGSLEGAGISACELEILDPEPAVAFEKREDDEISWRVIAEPFDDLGSYYTLERLSDATISDIEADNVYDTVEPYVMELWDDGAEIWLVNPDGVPVSTANAFASPLGGWPAGDASTYGTMERTDPLGEDVAENWHTNIGVATNGTDAAGRPLVATANALNSESLEEWALFADLEPSRTLAGRRVEVGLDLTTQARRESGWPWIRVTRPAPADTFGGGAAAEPEPSVYAFSSRYAAGVYWLGIDTTQLAEGDHLIWIVYGEGDAVLVPITILP